MSLKEILEKKEGIDVCIRSCGDLLSKKQGKYPKLKALSTIVPTMLDIFRVFETVLETWPDCQQVKTDNGQQFRKGFNYLMNLPFGHVPIFVGLNMYINLLILQKQHNYYEIPAVPTQHHADMLQFLIDRLDNKDEFALFFLQLSAYRTQAKMTSKSYLRAFEAQIMIRDYLPKFSVGPMSNVPLPRVVKSQTVKSDTPFLMQMQQQLEQEESRHTSQFLQKNAAWLDTHGLVEIEGHFENRSEVTMNVTPIQAAIICCFAETESLTFAQLYQQVFMTEFNPKSYRNIATLRHSLHSLIYYRYQILAIERLPNTYGSVLLTDTFVLLESIPTRKCPHVLNFRQQAPAEFFTQITAVSTHAQQCRTLGIDAAIFQYFRDEKKPTLEGAFDFVKRSLTFPLAVNNFQTHYAKCLELFLTSPSHTDKHNHSHTHSHHH